VGITRNAIADALSARMRRQELEYAAGQLAGDRLAAAPPAADVEAGADRITLGEELERLGDPQKDVSNEPYDGNPGHSWDSIARGELAAEN